MNDPPTSRPLIYYRLGTARDKEPLARSNESVDGLVVGGHLFAWGQSWISIFLQRMNKPFFVDPMTYVFAKDPSFLLHDGELRKSYGCLVDWLDWKLADIVGKRPLRPEDFSNGQNNEEIREWVQRVLEFQKRIPRVGDRLQDSLEKYGKIIGKDLSKATVSPEFYLAPYFHASDPDDPWYQITIDCARAALDTEGYEPLVPVLCVSQSFITDSSGKDRVLDDLSEFDMCAIWISGLDEHKASIRDLEALRDLVDGLASQGVRTINLYGGFVSLLLRSKGIAITCSGPGYGESKKADQMASGGGFPDRYYIKQAILTVVEANARKFISRNPEYLCSCDVCTQLADSLGIDSDTEDFSPLLDIYFQSLRGIKTIMHYIRCRSEESALVGTLGPDGLRDKLIHQKNELETVNSASMGIDVDHLDRWASLL